MHVQSCCFACKTFFFFLMLSLPSASLDLEVPIVGRGGNPAMDTYPVQGGVACEGNLE